MDNPAREIPGFYYDTEKKKYFRITKDRPNPIEDKVNKTNVPQSQNSNKKSINIQQYKNSRFCLIKDRQIGKLSSQLFQRKYHTTVISDDHWPDFDTGVNVLSRSSFLPGDMEYNIQTISPNLHQDGIAIVSKIEGQERNVLQMYKVSAEKHFNISLRHLYPDFVLDQISSVCWNPHHHDRNTVLLSTLLSGGGTLFLYSFNDFQDNEEDSPLAFRHERYKPRIGCIWTAKWNPNPYYQELIGLGTYSGFALRTIGNWRNEKVIQMGSDVFAMDFGTKSSTLFCGTRNGKICMFDLRSINTWPRDHAMFVLNIGKTLDWIKLTKDEEKIIVSTMDGRLELWDLKMQRCLSTCNGHQNSHSRLSHGLSPDEEFIHAVGEDKIGRIWQLNSGTLLKSIRYNANLIDKTVNPCIVFGNKWARRSDMPGYMFGVQNSIYFYHV